MDVAWNVFRLLWICFGLYLIIFSLYTIVREQIQRRSALFSGEKLLPWYMNSTFRKQSEMLFYGVFAIGIIPILTQFLNHDQSVMLWVSLISFVGTCFIIAFLLYDEVRHRWVVRETGEDLPHKLYRYHFHQRIAFALYILGVSVSALLSGLIFVKAQSAEAMRQLDWLWESLMCVGILYWLTARILQEVKTRRARPSSH